MKVPHKFIVLVVTVLLIFSACSQSYKDRSMASSIEADVASVDEAPSYVSSASVSRSVSGSLQQTPNFLSTGAALNVNDGDHLLIRTAQSRFKVRSVADATYAIENIVLRNKGIIMQSSINNNKWSETEIPVSKDSSLITAYNNLTANMQLRIPKDLLDETLREIAPLALEIDYRTLMAEDVTFDILMNQLTQARMERKSKRVSNAIASRSGKLADAVSAEEALDNVEEMADAATIEKLRLKDRIEFSTINIQLYQDRIESRTMVKRAESVKPYESSMGTKALHSLSNGWFALCSILVFLLNFWPLFLIVFVGAFIYLRLRKKS